MRRVWLSTFRVFIIRTIAASTCDTSKLIIPTTFVYSSSFDEARVFILPFGEFVFRANSFLRGKATAEERDLILAVLEHSLSSACVFLYSFFHLDGINLQSPISANHKLPTVEWAWALELSSLVQMETKEYLYSIKRSAESFIEFERIIVLHIPAFWQLKEVGGKFMRIKENLLFATW